MLTIKLTVEELKGSAVQFYTTADMSKATSLERQLGCGIGVCVVDRAMDYIEQRARSAGFRPEKDTATEDRKIHEIAEANRRKAAERAEPGISE